MPQIASLSFWLGRSTNISSSNRPLRNISGGSCDTSLAVATTNTGDVFSCIQEIKDPNTLEDVPPSVELELLTPLKPLSNSSIHRQQGAMASAVWMTERRLDSDCPTSPAKILPASNLSNGTPKTFAVAL